MQNNKGEAAEINMRWIQGVELETMKLALDAAALDSRISTYTTEMYQAKSMPFLVSLGRLDAAFDPSDAIDTSFLKAAMESNPEAFSDLPEIPDAIKVK